MASAPESSRRVPPRTFVSHGTGDRVLSSDRCSRRIVPRLTRAGREVEYRDGPHTVPPEMAKGALAWSLG